MQSITASFLLYGVSFFTAPIHVTLLSNQTWENGIEYTEVKCMADNASPDANITWDTMDCRSGISAPEPRRVVARRTQDPGVVWITARLPVYSHSGCTLICVLHSHGLEKPVQKSIHIPLTSMFYTNVPIYV